MKKRSRLSIEVGPSLEILLDDLARRIHGSKSDVIRKSIALMEVAVDAKEKGLEFGSVKDGKLETRVVGL